ncbi:MAG: ribonuclease H-like domain-containing protein [Lachnospiraceae bacterium]|nr:ribonuclease H-like domain-containing protein [Lachnospiraceae bacterium]
MIESRVNSMSLPEDIYPSLRPGDILVNIETTGLRPSSCFVFMAGWAVLAEGCEGSSLEMNCRTLLAEARRDEEALLGALREAISGSRRLVLFGAYSFVLRFLSERWNTYEDGDFLPSGTEVLCLQKMLAPWKERLRLSSLRKYDIENRLGFRRSDRISGEELVKKYSEWEKERTENCRERLLAHSQEDLRSLAFMSRCLVFNDFAESPDGSLEELSLPDSGTLCVRLSMPYEFPCSASWENGYALISFTGRTSGFHIACFKGTLKYFFPGKVSNYYYLPDEDCAVHKSVARFVDRDHRVKASPATCYSKREGVFLPLPENSPYSLEYPVFTPEYRSHLSYAEFEAEKWCSDRKILHLYLKSLLH